MLPVLRVQVALALLAPGLLASRCDLPPSRHLERIPDHGSCDVVVSPLNFTTTLAQLNDATKRVFCVEPGDYREAGNLVLTASGTQSSRRFLRFRGDRHAIDQSARALFESFWIQGSWWIVQGLTVAPLSPETRWLVSIQGGDRNVIHGNLIDASQQWNADSQEGVNLSSLGSNPASHNSIQANVIRGGNRSRIWIDYAGVIVLSSIHAGGNNDFNKILDNEIFDWGDGIQIYEGGTCNAAARPRGTLIDGNDVYISRAKRVDCTTGNPDPDGDCSCSENGIDIKPNPGASPGLWTRVTNNRLWGFRPTLEPRSCGGSGSRGQAITAGNSCAGHVLVAGNIVLDSTTGVSLNGPGWIVAGNLFHEIRVPRDGRGGVGTAIFPSTATNDVDVQFNTLVGVDNAYDDAASNADARCNVVVENGGTGGQLAGRGFNSATAYNYLYDSSTANFFGPTNLSFPTAAHSGNTQYCFARRRWTGPSWLCIPFGHTTPESPQQAAASSCDTNLLSAFGVPVIGYR